MTTEFTTREITARLVIQLPVEHAYTDEELAELIRCEYPEITIVHVELKSETA